MNTDLHWVVKPKHRKTGYLQSALKSVIIPYVFENFNWEKIDITIYKLDIGKENYEASSNAALKLEFTTVDDLSFIWIGLCLHRDELNSFQWLIRIGDVRFG